MASQSIRTSQRCVATTLAGHQCKNRSTRGKKCWVHLKKIDGLRVKKSNIAGLGLFTTKPRKNNERVATYKGESMTRAQVAQRYGDRTAQYVYCRSKNRCRDARKSNAGVARFANDARGGGKRNNTKFSGFSLRTKRKVPAGAELLLSYGREYWRSHNKA